MPERRGPTNPYFYSQPVKNIQQFYGRHDLVRDVVNVLTNSSQNVVVLHGQRRIGKSSLLYRLRRDDTLQQYFLPVFFDMQTYEGALPPRILSNLAENIVQELSVEIPIPNEANLATDYRQFKKQFLPSVSEHLNEQRLLVLCDEFDVALPPDTSGTRLTGTFPGYLRELITEEQDRIAFVFVVGQRIDLLSEGHLSLFKGALTQYVGRLKEEDTRKLLIELGHQGNIRYTEDALAEIWTLTNGHPFVTQLIASEIFSNLHRKGKQQASAIDVKNCLDKAMEHGTGGLDWFWRELTLDEQFLLSAVADLTDHQSSVNDAEIDQTLKKHQIFLPTLDRNETYTRLLQGDFLQEADPQSYRFTVEFIRRWIVKYHSIREVKRQIEQMDNDANMYYDLGRRASVRGDLDEAIKNYHKVLELNHQHVNAYIALAHSLKAKDKIPEAIEEYENAYLRNEAAARDPLIELRMKYAEQLEHADDQEAMLEQVRRVLQIEPTHNDARIIVGDIYLGWIEMQLKEDQFDEALKLGEQLTKLILDIQNDNIGQRIREMWLDYSHMLTRHSPPRWNEAKTVLDSLNDIELINNKIREAYNDLILNRAQFYFAEDATEQALSTLVDELKPPRPFDRIKELLLPYSKEKIKNHQWEQADLILQNLCDLTNADADSLAARQNLYYEWGDALLRDESFDEAITVYRRGEPESIKPKITQAYLQQAYRLLFEEKLSQAQVCYRHALEVQNNLATKEKIREDLVAYFDQSRRERNWSVAQDVLSILGHLELADSKTASLHERLQLEHAEAELGEGNVDAAFKKLKELDDDRHADIKSLIWNYIQQSAQRSNWQLGADVLENMESLFPEDTETTIWRANWLFLWAKSLNPEDKLDENLTQAKDLCRKLLTSEFEAIPIISLGVQADSAPEQNSGDLRTYVCELFANIVLDQAQSALDNERLSDAQRFFEEALSLSFYPKDLKQDILDKLLIYYRSQTLKEKTEEARCALEVALQLNVGDPQTISVLKKLPMTEADRHLKEDKFERAFEELNRHKDDISDEKLNDIKTKVYQFSRLYVGRNLWSEAKETLGKLQEWSAPHADEIRQLRDALNREHLNFIKGKKIRGVVSPEEIERLDEEVQLAEAGYQDAKLLELNSLQTWTDDFVMTSLTLGQSYLDAGNLGKGIRVYKRILGIENKRLKHKEQIAQCLHNYSEQMLNRQEWTEALETLMKLKSFKLVAPDGATRPDPRVDGAIQRVTLLHIESVLLAEDRIENTFCELDKLPRPRPTGRIKDIILTYSEKRQKNNDWENAVEALKCLNQFLFADDAERRDQGVLDKLVQGYEEWGKYLEENKTLVKAAVAYRKAVHYTRGARHNRNIELAEEYIRVTRNLAQQCLDADSSSSEIPRKIRQAIRRYRKILALPEHKSSHEEKINHDLYQYAVSLTDKEQWRRAYQLINLIYKLYPPTPNIDYATNFAKWRKELALKEVQVWLERRQPEKAFEQLKELKEWLGENQTPTVSWETSIVNIKPLVNAFCRTWLEERAWTRATQTLTHLDTLIPNDSEIIGWIVEAHYQWGRYLQQMDQLPQAIERYHWTLEKVSHQDKISRDRIEQSLLAAQLTYAQSYLDLGRLNEAIDIYEEALEKSHENLDRADKIRRALKDFSDSLIEPASPDWDAARQALNCLSHLDLDNSMVFEWRQKLTLKEVREALLRDDLEVAFASLETMEQPRPKHRIQDLIHRYSFSHTGADNWKLATQSLSLLGKFFNDDKEGKKWVETELDKLGQKLDKQNNLEGAREAFTLARHLKLSLDGNSKIENGSLTTEN